MNLAGEVKALPGKEKTATKGNPLTAVFFRSSIQNHFPLHLLAMRLIGGRSLKNAAPVTIQIISILANRNFWIKVIGNNCTKCPPNELRVDAAGRGKAEQRKIAPPHQTELN